MPSGWQTALVLINRVAFRCGIVQAAITDGFGNADQNVVQLCTLLSEVGEALARRHPWTHLQKTATFTTVNGVADYDTPGDFLKTLDQTHWNRETQLPLLGPVTGPGWQLLKATDADYVTSKVFRVMGDKIHLHPTPTAAEQVAYEYVSRFWVVTTGNTEPSSDVCSSDNDVIWFDPHLVVTALALAWKGEKGLDTGKAQADFDLALAAATGGDGVASPLPLNGTGLRTFRLIDGLNLPDGNLDG